MANVVVIGMQWGDEGKGKVVDLLCPALSAVVRYQGGHNAGHTVKFADQHFALRLIPSGAIHPEVRCILGNGMVLAPDAFFREIESLEAAGVDTRGRLWISNRTPVLLPLHAALDQAREAARGADRIGTTSRGIGPAYESKVSRFGLRTCDLLGEDLSSRLAALLGRVAPELAALGAEPPPTVEELEAQCRAWGERLAPFVAPTDRLLSEWMSAGESILFEGAQGTFLDVEHGTYPFVTSSNTLAGAASTGAGVPPHSIDGVIGILKAYTTRVGQGPFPSELDGGIGEHLQQRGNEYGTVTGRPRRCGWLDTVAAAQARRLSGVDTIALTKLDVLDELDEIPVCTGYRLDGQETDEVPPDAASLARIEPVLETLPGWRTETVGATCFDDLPPKAQAYVRFVEEKVGAPVGLISTGPRREETLLRPEIEAFSRLTGIQS